MKLVNATAETFASIFGQEALELIQGHEGAVYLATEGMFPQLDNAGKAGGCVVPVNPETLEILGEGPNEISMILFPDRLTQEAAAVPENMYAKYMTSVVLHELEHVKQIASGRMDIKAFGLLMWEGEEYKLDMAGYIQCPWEFEAYMAQFTHILGNKELAQRAYDHIKTANFELA